MSRPHDGSNCLQKSVFAAVREDIHTHACTHDYTGATTEEFVYRQDHNYIGHNYIYSAINILAITITTTEEVPYNQKRHPSGADSGQPM